MTQQMQEMNAQAIADSIAFEKFMANITTFNRRVFLVSARSGFVRLAIADFFIQGQK